MGRCIRTSFLVTGFPTNDRYVSFLKPARGSKSVSWASLFFVSTSVVRFGRLALRFACMVVMRFCARNRVRRRGVRGKFPSIAMSLSVKSMASFS